MGQSETKQKTKKLRWYHIIFNYLCCCVCFRNKVEKKEPRDSAKSTRKLLSKKNSIDEYHDEHATSSSQIGTTTEDSRSSNQEAPANTTQKEPQKKTNNSKESASSRVEIIDVHQDIDNFNPDTSGIPKHSKEYIIEIEKRAKTFEDSVKNYHGTNYSLEYYKLAENLARYIDFLDKVKMRDDEELLREKIRVIEYIKKLQTTLDSRVTED